MLIFGFSSYAKVLGVMMSLCGRCGNNAAHHVVRRGTKFSLFFIPLIPLSSRYALECSICGQARALTKQEAASLAAAPDPAPVDRGRPTWDPEQASYPQQPGGTKGFPQYPRQPHQDNPWQQG
ncbi:zinc-ribbon domain-containing protein [Mariniluteicoccus endophyticus]